MNACCGSHAHSQGPGPARWGAGVWYVQGGTARCRHIMTRSKRQRMAKRGEATSPRQAQSTQPLHRQTCDGDWQGSVSTHAHAHAKRDKHMQTHHTHINIVDCWTGNHRYTRRHSQPPCTALPAAAAAQADGKHSSNGSQPIPQSAAHCTHSAARPHSAHSIPPCFVWYSILIRTVLKPARLYARRAQRLCLSDRATWPCAAAPQGWAPLQAARRPVLTVMRAAAAALHHNRAGHSQLQAVIHHNAVAQEDLVAQS